MNSEFQPLPMIKMNPSNLISPAAGILLFALSCAAQAQAVVFSGFDANAEGWSANADSKNFAWGASGGNPGGYITASDLSQGLNWYYVAPAAYLGDKAAFLDGTLSFDLRQASTSSPYDASDIILVGGGVTLTYDTPYNPGTTWTHYAVTLGPSGWKNGADQATLSDFTTVLADLSSLQIRGEYRVGADTSYLDNVMMMAPVPEPEAYVLLLAGLGVVAVAARRRSAAAHRKSC